MLCTAVRPSSKISNFDLCRNRAKFGRVKNKKKSQLTKYLQVEAYIRKKEAREEAIKREKKEIKVLKEEKQMRLLRQRENQMGQEDEQDALRAKQAQEATEREWRRKEREAQLRNGRK